MDQYGENGRWFSRDEAPIRWDSWQNYEKTYQNGQYYAIVGGRLYSKHAVDRMQPSGNRFGPNIYQGLNGMTYGRSIAPVFIEYVIKNSEPSYEKERHVKIYTLGTVKVVVSLQGTVVTIITYQ